MSPDPWTTILRRLDDDPPWFYAEEARAAFGKDATPLVVRGWLKRMPPSGTATCWSCGDGAVQRVVSLWDEKERLPRWYLPCRRCGPHPVDPESLECWAVDVDRILAQLRLAAGIRGQPTELVEGRLWDLGRAGLGRRQRRLYFGRAIHDRHRAAAHAELAGKAKAALLLPADGAAARWRLDGGPVAVAVEAAFAPAADGLAFDPDALEACLAEADPAGPAARPKAAPRRGTRLDKIERLVRVLTDHLAAARDHAAATRRLLPRPTQKQLALQAGMSGVDVSRCLHDPAARELRLYWAVADDLDQVLNWRGRISRGG